MYYKEEISYASAIYRTSDFLKNDLEYEKFSKFNDWPFLVKIAGSGNSVLFCDSGLFYTRIHSGQDTNTFENIPSIEQIINWDKFFYQKLNAGNIFSARHYLFMNRFKYFLLGKYLKFLPENVKAKISQKDLLNMAEASGLKHCRLKLFYSLFEHPKIKNILLKNILTAIKNTACSFYLTAITSISTSAFLGNSFTATQERAGFDVKYFAYTSLNATKSLISAKKQVVLTTSSKSYPAAFNSSDMFSIHFCVCSSIVPFMNSPVFASRGICPEQYSVFPHK